MPCPGQGIADTNLRVGKRKNKGCLSVQRNKEAGDNACGKGRNYRGVGDNYLREMRLYADDGQENADEQKKGYGEIHEGKEFPKPSEEDSKGPLENDSGAGKSPAFPNSAIPTHGP